MQERIKITTMYSRRYYLRRGTPPAPLPVYPGQPRYNEEQTEILSEIAFGLKTPRAPLQHPNAVAFSSRARYKNGEINKTFRSYVVAWESQHPAGLPPEMATLPTA